MVSELPKFSDLPLNKGDPPYSAWTLYGRDDELGTLNRLTQDVVVEAAKEIRSGIRISMNWALDAQADIPFFGRQPFEKKIQHKAPRCVNDDTWYFNTQSSSQWDGLRHFAYQKESKFYNGVTLDDIHGESKSNINGIQAWAKQGIVGRGILIDYHRYCRKNEIPQSPFETSDIKLTDLKAAIKDQGLELKFGDILIVRSGYMAVYKDLARGEVEALSEKKPPGLAGVEQSEEVLKWIWENFAAVAGDHPSFEAWPPQEDPVLHEVLLSGWGCPIGELFDLEALAEHCEKENRWSFFITSEVCNVPGGVASPPNILAIF